MIARRINLYRASPHSGDAGGQQIISKHISSQSIAKVNRKTASLDAVSVAEDCYYDKSGLRLLNIYRK